MVWANLSGELEWTRTGVDGEVLVNQTLPLRTETARDPILRIASNGRVHLLWRDGEESSATVRYALLEADGVPVGQPRILSDPEGHRFSQ